MTFIKKKPIFLSLSDFKILNLILTEREIEDAEDNLQPQTREIELRKKIQQIIGIMEKAEAYRARQRALLPDQLVSESLRMEQLRDQKVDSSTDDFRDHYFTRDS